LPTDRLTASERKVTGADREKGVGHAEGLRKR
jgi:hypothetical protein